MQRLRQVTIFKDRTSLCRHTIHDIFDIESTVNGVRRNGNVTTEMVVFANKRQLIAASLS